MNVFAVTYGTDGSIIAICNDSATAKQEAQVYAECNFGGFNYAWEQDHIGPSIYCWLPGHKGQKIQITSRIIINAEPAPREVVEELFGLAAGFHDAGEKPHIRGAVLTEAGFTLLTDVGKFDVEVKKHG